MKICVAICHVLAFAAAVLLVTFGILGLYHQHLFVGRFVEDLCGENVIDRVKPPNNPITKIFYIVQKSQIDPFFLDRPILLVKEMGPYTFREEWLDIASTPSIGTLMFNKRYSFSLNHSCGKTTEFVPGLTLVSLMTLYERIRDALSTREYDRNFTINAYLDFFYGGYCLSTVHQHLYTFEYPCAIYNYSIKAVPFNPIPRYHYIGFFNNNESRDTFGFEVPTPLTKNSTVYLYHPDLCNPLPLVFQRELELNGMSVLRFGLSPNLFGQNGLLNVTQCHPEVLMGLSLPHFLNDAERVLKYDGLEPNPGKHASYINVEPHSGIVVQAKIRLQYNVFMSSLSKLRNSILHYNKSNLTFEPLDVLVPYCWVEWGFEDIPQTAAMKQWLDCSNELRKILEAICYSCLAMGVLISATTLAVQVGENELNLIEVIDGD